MSDLFAPGDYKFIIRYRGNEQRGPLYHYVSNTWGYHIAETCPERMVEQISLIEVGDADANAIQTQKASTDPCGIKPLTVELELTFKIILTQSGYLYLCVAEDESGWEIIEGAAYIGRRRILHPIEQYGKVYRVHNPAGMEPLPPGEEPTPGPAPGSEGPQLHECVFPALQLNFIQVLSDLAAWIGCILRNIITLLHWAVDWLLHFPDHLDAWISRLFGIDPAKPFFDELMHKIDVKVSARLGVDADKPLLDELAKKLIGYLFELLASRAENSPRKWR